MSSSAAQTSRSKPTREEALAIAAARKTARAHRTTKIRKTVAALAAAAFLGPFAVIYGHVASGKDPGLAASTASGSTIAGTTGSSTSGSTTSRSDSSRSTTSGSTTSSGSASTGSGSTSTSSVAPITTQQS